MDITTFEKELKPLIIKAYNTEEIINFGWETRGYIINHVNILWASGAGFTYDPETLRDILMNFNKKSDIMTITREIAFALRN